MEENRGQADTTFRDSLGRRGGCLLIQALESSRASLIYVPAQGSLLGADQPRGLREGEQ